MSTRTIPVLAVFEDGTVPTNGDEPLLVSAQNLTFQQWTDGELAITAVGSNGAPYDVSGGAFIFSARTRNEAAPPVISHEADIDNGPAGLAHVDIGSVDVGIPVQVLAWNLIYINAAGKIWGVTAQGSFTIAPSQYTPGQDVTVPASQQPLAQGPNIGHAFDFDALPDPTTKAWLWFETDDNGNVYYSNGVAWVLPSGGGLPDPSGFVDGTVPIVESAAWTYRQLTAADIAPAFAVASIAGGGGYAATKEVGDTVVNPSFTIGYTSGPPTSATIDDGLGAVALTTPFTSKTYAHTYALAAIGTVVTWLVAALKGAASASRSITTTALGRVFYGAHADGTYNAAFIAALATQALAGARQRTINTTTGAGEYVFYAFPASFGGTSANFIDVSTGFAFGVSKVAAGVSVTNGFGTVTSVDLWRSDFPNLGATSMQVT